MRVFFIAVLMIVVLNGSAYGYLGGFEHDDGYITVFINNNYFAGTNPETGGPTPDYDVSKYNAGEFGANVNPSANYVNNPSGTGGLWVKTMGPLIGSGQLPGIGNPPPPYASGHLDASNAVPPVRPIQGARALVVTTNSQGWRNPSNPTMNGPAQGYEYSIDNFDLHGMTPANTGNQKLKLSFYSCASLNGPDDDFPFTGTPGLVPGSFGHSVSFFDGLNNLGFEVGYTQPGTKQDFAAIRVASKNGGNWYDTGIPVQPDGWHRWDIELDLRSQSVSIDFTPVTSFIPNPPRNIVHGTTVNVVSSAPLLTGMNSLEKLGFTSSAGINNSKVWALDDFEFCITEAPLSSLLSGGTLWSGDKQFSDFSYHGGGDMPAAEDIFVKAITDADGNVGIRFQGAFVDAAGGGASDALIDFLVTAPEGKLIKDVHMAANPLVIGGGNTAGLVSVTETFLADNDQTVLSVFDLKPGSRKLTDWADLVDADGNLAPVQQLHVQKDIIAWAQQLGSAATMSFIDQTFSQCDADPANSGVCRVVDPPMGHPGDFNGDGMVNAADYTVWRNGLGSIYTQADYEIWKAHFGESWPAGSSATSSVAVPEPTSWAMAGACLATLLFWQGRSIAKARC